MNFFKTFLAALLAVIVGFGLIVMLWTMIVVGIVASFGARQTAIIQSGSVLRLDLGRITDSPSTSLFDGFDFASLAPVSHTSLLATIEAVRAAATDDRIDGLYINFDEKVSVSLSSLEEIRAELVKFKESGKPVVAYQEDYGQIGYWLATVADKVYINPAGGVQWHGLAVQMMFYKGLLDKLDIEPVVVRHGSFKSAVEPFINEKMSPENRLQYQKMTSSLWGFIVEGVAESRGIAAADLQRYADELAIDSPEAAVAKGLVDGMLYEDQVMAEMAGEKDEPKIVSFADYASQVAPAKSAVSRNKIAVVYAEGDIVSGDGAQGQVGSAAMAKKLARVRKDDNVKAVVFRINSPGGSALAAEVMWRELELLKAEKPVVVSMGSYAASGGYYIAAPADAIVADRTTLTGSIGVFGLFANVGDALKGKLGITTDVVRTAAHSDIGSLYRAPSSAELAYYQRSVEKVYSTFVGHVAEGRNMSFEAVDNIGQGRVWTGADALEIGLVDGFGGITDAIALAADRVGVADDFRVSEVVDTPTGLDAFFSGLSTSVRRMVLRDELAESFVHYDRLRRMLDDEGVQARMPYTVEIQ